jgi:hypothetical protein
MASSKAINDLSGKTKKRTPSEGAPARRRPLWCRLIYTLHLECARKEARSQKPEARSQNLYQTFSMVTDFFFSESYTKAFWLLTSGFLLTLPLYAC